MAVSYTHLDVYKRQAQETFKLLRNKYNIDSKLSRYDAMDRLQNDYGVYPPIYVKKMIYTNDIELENFLGKFGFIQEDIDKGISAEKAFKTLRKDFKIDKNLSDLEAVSYTHLDVYKRQLHPMS